MLRRIFYETSSDQITIKSTASNIQLQMSRPESLEPLNNLVQSMEEVIFHAGSRVAFWKLHCVGSCRAHCRFNRTVAMQDCDYQFHRYIYIHIYFQCDIYIYVNCTPSHLAKLQCSPVTSPQQVIFNIFNQASGIRNVSCFRIRLLKPFRLTRYI